MRRSHYPLWSYAALVEHNGFLVSPPVESFETHRCSAGMLAQDESAPEELWLPRLRSGPPHLWRAWRVPDEWVPDDGIIGRK
jgi:hypothetical protein